MFVFTYVCDMIWYLTGKWYLVSDNPSSNAFYDYIIVKASCDNNRKLVWGAMSVRSLCLKIKGICIGLSACGFRGKCTLLTFLCFFLLAHIVAVQTRVSFWAIIDPVRCTEMVFWSIPFWKVRVWVGGQNGLVEVKTYTDLYIVWCVVAAVYISLHWP